MLYSLLRDFVHPGDLETIVAEIERAVNRGDKVTKYTNGWLALYAKNISERLRKALPGMNEAAWRTLTDEQRLELMSVCCRGCGTLSNPCYCMHDE